MLSFGYKQSLPRRRSWSGSMSERCSTAIDFRRRLQMKRRPWTMEDVSIFSPELEWPILMIARGGKSDMSAVAGDTYDRAPRIWFPQDCTGRAFPSEESHSHQFTPPRTERPRPRRRLPRSGPDRLSTHANCCLPALQCSW